MGSTPHTSPPHLRLIAPRRRVDGGAVVGPLLAAALIAYVVLLAVRSGFVPRGHAAAAVGARLHVSGGMIEIPRASSAWRVLELDSAAADPGDGAAPRASRQQAPAEGARICDAGVVTQRGRALVFVDRGAGRLAPVEVQAGPSEDGWISVRGLAPGTRYVCKGALFLASALAQAEAR